MYQTLSPRVTCRDASPRDPPIPSTLIPLCVFRSTCPHHIGEIPADLASFSPWRLSRIMPPTTSLYLFCRSPRHSVSLLPVCPNPSFPQTSADQSTIYHPHRGMDRVLASHRDDHRSDLYITGLKASTAWTDPSDLRSGHISTIIITVAKLSLEPNGIHTGRPPAN